MILVIELWILSVTVFYSTAYFMHRTEHNKAWWVQPTWFLIMSILLVSFAFSVIRTFEFIK